MNPGAIVSKIPERVDNKRKHMKKGLPQAERAQPLLTHVKDYAILKKTNGSIHLKNQTRH